MSRYGGVQHGDKFNKKDKYDNPIQYTGGNIGGHGHKKQTPGSREHSNKEHFCCSVCGILPRSNNSSSSSSSSTSEDDGQGGRRKKSLKEKIKEKLSGGNKPAAGTGQVQDAYAHGHGATITTPGENGQVHDAYAHGHGATTTTPGENNGGGDGSATTTHDEQQQLAEKKGLMDKIKDKLPGHH